MSETNYFQSCLKQMIFIVNLSIIIEGFAIFA